MAQPRPNAKRIPVREPDYTVISDLRAELATTVAKYGAIYPAMALKLGVEAKILTTHGDETIRVTIKDIPPYEQQPLFSLEDIDMDMSYKARLETWKQMQKEVEEEKRKEKEQDDDDE